jgi:hypothetical protein
MQTEDNEPLKLKNSDSNIVNNPIDNTTYNEKLSNLSKDQSKIKVILKHQYFGYIFNSRMIARTKT